MVSGRGAPPGGSGPRGGKRRPTARPSVRPNERRGQRAGGARSRAVAATQLPRPKLTGRAAVLVLVVSVLMVSYASSLRAYLEQRQQLGELNAKIARSNANIKELKAEKARFDDPAYVKYLARLKFGFVMPGEIGFTVIDANGQPLGQAGELSEPPVTEDGRPEWYDAAWDSVLLAGHPPDPADEPKPADKIKPPRPDPAQ